MTTAQIDDPCAYCAHARYRHLTPPRKGLGCWDCKLDTIPSKCEGFKERTTPEQITKALTQEGKATNDVA